MSLHEILRDVIVRLAVERPATSRSTTEWAETLAASGAKLKARMTAIADTPANCRQLRHIIGLERWGQRRMRVALGEPFINDEMDEYEPPVDLRFPDLIDVFLNTRDETVNIARRCAADPRTESTRVQHNQLGPLSIRGWLRYLDLHARLEARWLH
ncbi:hypothetical protein [Roseiflexus castenholzii]|uniref:DinB-like domain-containing protein n=1 Tax=Roseiflexus castenholzii (strain DSM 13941 / HLO8) TaxID=383372 RepID=A7NQR6_ROSCS|nr:hypothetical protein [Roseiflexus castenholzii]ABU59912.1 conserved hypothetical protein [Roseiflexus castenholzii DSM 13941]